MTARTRDAAHDAELPSEPAPTMGELRSRWRSEHICLGCGHYAVCKMASALDPSFLVVISHCLVFEPAEPGELGRR